MAEHSGRLVSTRRNGASYESQTANLIIGILSGVLEFSTPVRKFFSRASSGLPDGLQRVDFIDGQKASGAVENAHRVVEQDLAHTAGRYAEHSRGISYCVKTSCFFHVGHANIISTSL